MEATLNPQPDESLATDHARLLEQAMSQPGVQDAMRIYGEWQQLEIIAQADRQAMAITPSVWVSDSANPVAQETP